MKRKSVLRKIIDLVFPETPKAEITYCPLCKSYILDGVKFYGQIEKMPGYKNAKRKVCYGCSAIIQTAKGKINLDVSKLGVPIQFESRRIKIEN